MAAKTKLEKRQARKERLIKQNDLYRRDLMAEEDHLRDGAEWIERGRGYYQLASKLSLIASPFRLFRPGRKQQGSFSKIWNGMKFLKKLRTR